MKAETDFILFAHALWVPHHAPSRLRNGGPGRRVQALRRFATTAVGHFLTVAERWLGQTWIVRLAAAGWAAPWGFWHVSSSTRTRSAAAHPSATSL